VHWARVSGLRDQTTILFVRLCLRAAMAMEAPNKPAPRIVICSNIRFYLKWVLPFEVEIENLPLQSRSNPFALPIMG
jgi:hypothetical protein